MSNEKLLLEKLEKERQEYENYIGRDSEVVHFMEYCIKLLKEIDFCQNGIIEGVKSLIIEQDKLIKKVKKLEQAKTFFPMTEDKHRALLNNCVDDDEAILHKREIEEAKQAEKV